MLQQTLKADSGVKISVHEVLALSYSVKDMIKAIGGYEKIYILGYDGVNCMNMAIFACRSMLKSIKPAVDADTEFPYPVHVELYTFFDGLDDRVSEGDDEYIDIPEDVRNAPPADYITSRPNYAGPEPIQALTESQEHMKTNLSGFKHKSDLEAAERVGYTVPIYRAMLANMCCCGIAKVNQESDGKTIIFQ